MTTDVDLWPSCTYTQVHTQTCTHMHKHTHTNMHTHRLLFSKQYSVSTTYWTIIHYFFINLFNQGLLSIDHIVETTMTVSRKKGVKTPCSCEDPVLKNSWADSKQLTTSWSRYQLGLAGHLKVRLPTGHRSDVDTQFLALVLEKLGGAESQ